MPQIGIAFSPGFIVCVLAVTARTGPWAAKRPEAGAPGEGSTA
ncbi:hypothetical protein [Streptomyces hilarionis]|nr:hypothetical protein [Streptomyces hilarionis]